MTTLDIIERKNNNSIEVSTANLSCTALIRWLHTVSTWMIGCHTEENSLPHVQGIYSGACRWRCLSLKLQRFVA